MSRTTLLTALACGLVACGGETAPPLPDLRIEYDAMTRDRGVDGPAADLPRLDQHAADSCAQKAWYADQDGDGFGDPKVSKQACAQPSGYVADQSDCDDASKDVHPGAAELCNSVDDDCNGKLDDVASGSLSFCKDGDGDGYGDPKVKVQGCAPPPGHVVDCGDCNDADAAVNPKAKDTPDASGVDTNCDGLDGDLAQAILVSATSGDDGKDGKGSFANGVLTASPVKSVAKGIELAALCTPAPCYVLIAEGSYDSGASAHVLKPGVSLHGGYQDVTWARSLTRDKVVLTSQSSPAVSADSLAVATSLERLTVLGPDLSKLTTSGLESVGLIVSKTSGSGMLTLRNVQVAAGKGSPGQAGVGGANGPTQTCNCTGGAGSPTENACWTLPENEVPGSPGLCGGGGGGKMGAYSCQHLCGGGPGVGNAAVNGGSGASGANGANGGSGAGGTAAAPAEGSFTGSDWAPTLSTKGADGANGGGGGGGGGGGHYRWWCDVFMNANTVELSGGVGGKGGDGGCAGKAGMPGGAGGAAIALVLLESTVTFDGVELKLGVGGAGGNGGAGGYGQGFTPGAAGGANQTGGSYYGLCPPFGPPLCPYYPKESGAGGKGGDGGFGGGGGGGAGGHGGPSYGLVILGALLPAGLPTYETTGASGGAKGIGGAGGKAGDNVTLGGKGADGANGTQVQCLLGGTPCP